MHSRTKCFRRNLIEISEIDTILLHMTPMDAPLITLALLITTVIDEALMETVLQVDLL